MPLPKVAAKDLSALVEPAIDSTPDVIDSVALARLYGEPLFAMPQDLYIPPDALEVFLEAFQGPLDLLLYLIRKQNFNVLDIPMAEVTRQYLSYVDQIRNQNLELAGEYLLMAAMLIEIKSRMLLPVKKSDTGEEVDDPRAELVRRLLEYEQMKLAAQKLDALPQLGRDFQRTHAHADVQVEQSLPDISAEDLRSAWLDIMRRASLNAHHRITIHGVHRAVHGACPPRGRRRHCGGAFSCHAGIGPRVPAGDYAGRTLCAHIRAPLVHACRRLNGGRTSHSDRRFS
jgi:segregation and condensation protein A